MLVYDYLPNKRLDKILFCDPTFHNVEFLEYLHQILIGVALALAYLHNNWEHCMVHQDLKVNNVMLDQNFNLALEILALLE
jgi:interleukin-1 receptor-associated kinase 1